MHQQSQPNVVYWGKLKTMCDQITHNPQLDAWYKQLVLLVLLYTTSVNVRVCACACIRVFSTKLLVAFHSFYFIWKLINISNKHTNISICYGWNICVRLGEFGADNKFKYYSMRLSEFSEFDFHFASSVF